MIVGAYAVAAHGLPRATGDIDLWIKCSDNNADRVWSALTRFGAPLSNLSRQDLIRSCLDKFEIGAPNRVRADHTRSALLSEHLIQRSISPVARGNPCAATA